MKRVYLPSLITALSALIYAAPGHTVCFYPDSTLSGYRVPLNTEVNATPIIIIGKVTKVRYVQDDPADPDGITAYLYTVDRLQELKGSVPNQITLRAENDSGGYRMSTGETSLLFLKWSNGAFTANVCGNSTELPKGDHVVSEVRKLLAQQGVQP